MTNQDAANEVVRAAVAWNDAWNQRHSCEYAEGTDAHCAYIEARLDSCGWSLNNVVEAYLAKNLPDSAQHPTPNPG